MSASNGQMPLDLHDRPIALRAQYESVRRGETAARVRKHREPDLPEVVRKQAT